MTHPVRTTDLPVEHDGERLLLVQGTLSQLQVARSSINLLEQIERHVGAKSIGIGVAGAISDMHGVVANSAALALYDGEDSYNFAAILGEHVICGSFPHADRLKDGERVKAVVSQRGQVLYVHAIMNTTTQRLYMPMNVFSGSGGFFRNCMRIAWRFTVFLWILFAVIFGAIFYMNPPASPTGATKFAILLAFVFVGIPLTMFPFEYWTYRTFLGTGAYAEAIFKVFGFPNGRDIDLTEDTELLMDDKGWYAAWDAAKLLKNLNTKAV